jgi:hypothetical protein
MCPNRNLIPFPHGPAYRMAATSRLRVEGLEQVKTPLIDRAKLRELLRVYRRVAIRLMHRFCCYQAGPDVPDRPPLAQQLGNIAAASSLRRPTWRTANSPAFPPRSGLGPVSWRVPASTRRTGSAHGTRTGRRR